MLLQLFLYFSTIYFTFFFFCNFHWGMFYIFFLFPLSLFPFMVAVCLQKFAEVRVHASENGIHCFGSLFLSHTHTQIFSTFFYLPVHTVQCAHTINVIYFFYYIQYINVTIQFIKKKAEKTPRTTTCITTTTATHSKHNITAMEGPPCKWWLKIKNDLWVEVISRCVLHCGCTATVSLGFCSQINTFVIHIFYELRNGKKII